MKLPQLSLRDLFWLVALVAMGCGWWRRERAFQDELQRSREMTGKFAASAEYLQGKLIGEGYSLHWNGGQVHAYKEAAP